MPSMSKMAILFLIHLKKLISVEQKKLVKDEEVGMFISYVKHNQRYMRNIITSLLSLLYISKQTMTMDGCLLI